MTSAPEQRMQLVLREAVDYYVEQGWEITSRAPLTIERNHLRCEVRTVGNRAAKLDLPRKAPHD